VSCVLCVQQPDLVDHATASLVQAEDVRDPFIDPSAEVMEPAGPGRATPVPASSAQPEEDVDVAAEVVDPVTDGPAPVSQTKPDEIVQAETVTAKLFYGTKRKEPVKVNSQRLYKRERKIPNRFQK